MTWIINNPLVSKGDALAAVFKSNLNYEEQKRFMAKTNR